MSPNIAMLFGGLLWLIGELWGVRRNAKANGNMDTTSEWVWWLEGRKFVGPFVRASVLAFVLSLAGHFMFHWSLLP